MRINYKTVSKCIAPLDVVLSMFVFIMELHHPTNFKCAMLIGIDIDMFYTNHTHADEGTNTSRNFFVTTSHVFAAIQWVCGVFLLRALVWKQRQYAVPWLSFKVGSLLLQVASLLYYLITQKFWSRRILVPACLNIGIAYTVTYIVDRGMDELSSEMGQNEDEGFSLCGRICSENQGPDSAQRNEEVPDSAQRAEELPNSSQRAEEGPDSVQRAEEMPKSCQGAEELPERGQMAEKLPESSQVTEELPQNGQSAANLSESVQRAEEFPGGGQRADSVQRAEEVSDSVQRTYEGLDAVQTSEGGVNSCEKAEEG